MTPQEIISEIQKLPKSDWLTIKDSIEGNDLNQPGNAPLSEDEVLRILHAKGVIGNIPDLSKWTDDDESWEPMTIEGRSTSEIVIEDRGQ